MGNLTVNYKKLFKRLIHKSLSTFLLPHLSKYFERTVTVLLYHDVDPMKFESHMAYVKEHYCVISLRAYADHLNDPVNHKLPDNALIVTLDDGWKKNSQLISTLQRYDIPVTIFLCSELVGTNRKIWNYTLDRLGSDRQFNQKLKQMSLEDKTTALEQFNQHSAKKEYPQRSFLNFEEIESLRSHVDFQSHGMFHEVLSMCSDDQIAFDVTESAKRLSCALGTEIYAFAFPYGKRDQRCLNAVKSAGYQIARTSNLPGLNSSVHPKYELKSIGIPDNSSLKEFIEIVSWAKIRYFFHRGSRSSSDIFNSR